MTEQTSTGVDRLDEMLGGGLPPRSATLVYGPPFIGKRLLGRKFLLRGMSQGIPAIVVNTDAPAAEIRARMATIDPEFPEYDQAGLVHFVDTYSKAVGASEDLANVRFVDGLMNFNSLSAAVNDIQRELVGSSPKHNMMFDSVSTLVAHTNGQAAFRYLQVLAGRAKLAGATTYLILEAGMHSDAEVQAIKHLVDGVVELRNEKDRCLLQVEGLAMQARPGWVEYECTETEFALTGSFAAGRIR